MLYYASSLLEFFFKVLLLGNIKICVNDMSLGNTGELEHGKSIITHCDHHHVATHRSQVLAVLAVLFVK